MMFSVSVRHRPAKHRVTGAATFLAVASAACLLVACGSEGELESEDYGNLLVSPAGLVVVEEEHPTGWGRPDCFACHEMRNMHIVNRTGVPDLDLAEIRAIIREGGEESCQACHGTNGVEP